MRMVGGASGGEDRNALVAANAREILAELRNHVVGDEVSSSLVLKTQWIRMLGYLWATDQIFTVHERMSVLDVTRRVFMITVPKARHVEARHGSAG